MTELVWCVSTKHCDMKSRKGDYYSPFEVAVAEVMKWVADWIQRSRSRFNDIESIHHCITANEWKRTAANYLGVWVCRAVIGYRPQVHFVFKFAPPRTLIPLRTRDLRHSYSSSLTDSRIPRTHTTELWSDAFGSDNDSDWKCDTSKGFVGSGPTRSLVSRGQWLLSSSLWGLSDVR